MPRPLQDPTSVADLFATFRAARPGQTAQAVQLSRLNEIVAARTIPIAYGSPADFEAALRSLPSDQQAFVLERLALGLPAPVTRVGPAGRLDQVWFPVEIDVELPREILAGEVSAGEDMTGQNLSSSSEQIGTLVEGRQVGPNVLAAWVGAAYGDQWAGE